MLVLFELLFLTLLHHTSAQADEFSRDQTQAFSKDEMYQDIFPLCASNFSSILLKSADPWIVIFHQGMLDRAWKFMAVSLRGVVWVGMIDTNEETGLLAKLVTYLVIGTVDELMLNYIQEFAAVIEALSFK